MYGALLEQSEKNKVLKHNPIPVTICPPQTPQSALGINLSFHKMTPATNHPACNMAKTNITPIS
jgi:hypothetical protein